MMASDWNVSHKYIQECPGCNAIHETQRQNVEYCIGCRNKKPNL